MINLIFFLMCPFVVNIFYGKVELENVIQSANAIYRR